MTGIFIRRFFTGRIETRNRAYLFLLAALGVLLVIPLILAIFETASGAPLALGSWIAMIVTGGIGAIALANLVRNLILLRK